MNPHLGGLLILRQRGDGEYEFESIGKYKCALLLVCDASMMTGS